MIGDGVGSDAEEQQQHAYKPDAAAFQENSREALFDLTNLSDSTELWLIEWPPHDLPDFRGKQVSLSLQPDGCLGSFEGSSGKIYNIINSAAQTQNASVFLSSATETKTVGKISRQVSLVRYPEAEELVKQEAERKAKRRYQLAAGSSLINVPPQSSTPTRSSTKLRNSSRERTVFTHSSKRKSSLSEVGEESQERRRHIHQATGSTDRSTMDSR